MPYSYNDVGSKSPGDTIAVPFPFIERDDVFVLVDGVQVSKSLYSWTSDSLLECLPGFPSGTVTRVQRVTSVNELPGEQTSLGVFDSEAANTNDIFLLYLSQERTDLESDVAANSAAAVAAKLAAEDARDDAEQAEVDAESHKNSALASKIDAEQAEIGAEGHSLSAQVAKTAAEAALAGAIAAEAEAESHKDDAGTAKDLTEVFRDEVLAAPATLSVGVDIVTPERFGAPTDQDATAQIQQAIDYAYAEKLPFASFRPYEVAGSIQLKGLIDYQFHQELIATGSSTLPVVTIKDDGGNEEAGRLRGLRVRNAGTRKVGFLGHHMREWAIYDPSFEDFDHAHDCWGMIFTSTPDNRNASSNVIHIPRLRRVSNGILLTRDATIPGSKNTGASFNTFLGGYIQYGKAGSTVNRGIWNEVGEGNKALNVRCTTRHQYTRGWQTDDARTQLYGCAGDGPVGTAFIQPFEGPGQIDSITLEGNNVLDTAVPWNTDPETTCADIVAQVIADGNQDSPYRAIASGKQVMFFDLDGDGEMVTLGATRKQTLVVSSSGGIVLSSTEGNAGLMAGGNYATYGEDKNRWGYRRGVGGNIGCSGFYIGLTATGHLHEPEGNGMINVVEYEGGADPFPGMYDFMITQAGETMTGGRVIRPYARLNNFDNSCTMYSASGASDFAPNFSKSLLRVDESGPERMFLFDFIFTPTFTNGSGQLWVSFPPELTPVTIAGTSQYVDIGEVSGFKSSLAGRRVSLRFTGNQFQDGRPLAQIVFSDPSTSNIIVAGPVHMTSGSVVKLKGNGRLMVDLLRNAPAM